GVFRGSVPTASGAPAADGVLQLSDGDTITVEYIDADDGEGGINVSKTDTATADCRAPIISNIEESNLSDTTATIDWMTDEASTSVVRYGAVAPPTDEERRSALVTNHSVPLNGLEECTVYKYEVESADALGNTVTDNNGGQYYTFETYGNFPEIGIVPCHRGQAILDDDAYTCAASVVASVTDLDLNADPGVVETVEVLMTSTSEPDGEWITLTELDADSIRFEGTIALDVSAASADGLLQIAPGDLVSVSYYDEDDGEGNPLTNTDTARIDCVAPAIGDVVVTQLSNTRARIEWTTDEPATSRVDYGTSAALGSVVESAALTTNHSLVISGFDACGRVHFTVTSVDRHGDLRSLDADGVPFSFNMNEIGGLLFYDGFEEGSSWDLDGEWEAGTPGGLGSYAGDPEAGYSGSGVLGTDLTGQGSFAGDYEPNETVSALTPVIDASAANNLELIYKRKLGVRSGDSAGIETLTGGLTTVWRSSGSVNDSGWVESRHDISSAADGSPSLRVVFRIEADGSTQSFGWNLDEVIIKDATAPDYQACGGCGGAPTFAGVSSVQDPNACGPGGLELTWDAASAWGTASGGTYDVHRGSAPDFVPDSSNRIASGLTDTFYTDAGAPVDSEVWYVVRARSNESCTGGEGLADPNTLRLSGVETTVQPPPVSPGASLDVEKVGAAHARLAWDATLNTSHYVVRRSESADFSGAQDLGQTADTVFEDEDALT
ncbi:MAG: hypothetical protein V2J24_02390, partial [Pseudomonadales bacterium]|nr:hypothetical protein [Pseudomonadales bacterium]